LQKIGSPVDIIIESSIFGVWLFTDQHSLIIHYHLHPQESIRKIKWSRSRVAKNQLTCYVDLTIESGYVMYGHLLTNAVDIPISLILDSRRKIKWPRSLVFQNIGLPVDLTIESGNLVYGRLLTKTI
jgi:hypothetical protein